MTTTSDTEDVTLKISADVVSRFGEELFSSSFQALLELVKNSYDADATQVRIDVSPPVFEIEPVDGAEASMAPDQSDVAAVSVEEDHDAGVRWARRLAEDLEGTGEIVVADDGVGMTEADIRSGWLTLSTSLKRPFKHEGLRTGRERTPLGDKGLGRLGAQRLGIKLRLQTRSVTAPGLEHDVTIDFREFRPERTLEEVKLKWTRRASSDSPRWSGPAETGTVLTITGLKSPHDFELEDLEREIARLINPFAPVPGLGLHVRFDGEPVPLASIDDGLKAAALSHADVSFDGERLKTVVKIRREWFNLKDKRQQALLEKSFQGREDGGAGLVKALEATRRLGQYRPVASRKEPWLVQFEAEWQWPAALSDEAACGPFTMHLEQLPGEATRAKRAAVAGGSRIASKSVLNRSAEYTKRLREISGVSVYRDGFRVASENDLLNLGRAFTSGGSYYGLRPQNVAGYVSLTADGNPAIEEATDRETFRDTPALQQLNALLHRARDDINKILDETGRAAVVYAKELVKADAGVSTDPEDVAADAGAAREAGQAASEGLRRIEQTFDAALAPGANEEHRRAAREAAKAELAAVKSSLAAVARLAPLAETLSADVEEMERSLSELYETAGLGLVAETLSHEIAHIVNRLDERARYARPQLPLSGSPQLRLLVAEVKSASQALRGQLRHLDPMTRRARVRRTDVDLGHMVADIASYHAERLRSSGVAVEAVLDAPSVVFVSPGRLSQILDNLIINAEHWSQRGGEGRPRITVTARGASVSVSDTGPGVTQDMSENIFEFGVTGRPEGRGLGLFIARQLADLEGGTIALTRTPNGARSTFTVELQQTANEGA